MRCPCCVSWLVRRRRCSSFEDAVFRFIGRFPYDCRMCRYQFRSRMRRVPVQVIGPHEASLDTVRIACSWGLL